MAMLTTKQRHLLVKGCGDKSKPRGENEDPGRISPASTDLVVMKAEIDDQGQATSNYASEFALASSPVDMLFKLIPGFPDKIPIDDRQETRNSNGEFLKPDRPPCRQQTPQRGSLKDVSGNESAFSQT